MTMQIIQHIELTSSQSSITLSAIPQTYTDLLVKYSARSSAGGVGSILVSFNGSTSTFSARYLQGSGSSVASASFARFAGANNGAGETASTFSNVEMYIPNYTSSAQKSYSVDSAHENNATQAFQTIIAGLWATTDAITSISFVINDGSNFVSGSSATLYGINKYATSGTPKATGGIISFDAVNNKWVHAFTASGTFTPTTNLSNVEYLVIAGGGAGGIAGGSGAGGGGAGGYQAVTASLSATSYTVTVGAGGAGIIYGNGLPTSGSNSSFGALTTSFGGGRGGSIYGNWYAAAAGGSGGGGIARDGYLSGGAGTSGQGRNGGSGGAGSGAGGGGGGADAVGGNGSTESPAGSGGAGKQWLNGSYYAGGGGGAAGSNWGGSSGSGGIGGGGAGVYDTGTAGNGTSNSGGGGGANTNANGKSGNGGSGIVIVRYDA